MGKLRGLVSDCANAQSDLSSLSYIQNAMDLDKPIHIGEYSDSSVRMTRQI